MVQKAAKDVSQLATLARCRHYGCIRSRGFTCDVCRHFVGIIILTSHRDYLHSCGKENARVAAPQ